MPHYVGLDASKSSTSICVSDEFGAIVSEGVVATEPKAIAAFLRGDRRRYRRVGLESMGLAPWLYEGLARAGLPVVCIEARHAHAVLKEMRSNKTDRNDARGIAELMRVGAYRAVHVKTVASQEAKTLLSARRHLLGKTRELDNLLRGLLLQYGVKVARGRPTTFARTVARAATSATIKGVVASLLQARRALEAEAHALTEQIKALAAADPVCRRFMTVPGVGPLTALAFRTAIDVPERFRRARDVGAHLGLTPRRYRSGETDYSGRISRRGDAMARYSLYLAAWASLRKNTRPSSLKTWVQGVAARRGAGRAVVALARRIAVILHRMWIDGTDFREGQALA